MKTTNVTGACDLRDLGRLVTVHYPDRPDLALIAALRLLSLNGAATDIHVAYVRGALLTRRKRNGLRPGTVPVIAESRSADRDRNMLLVGESEPAILIVGPDLVLDIASTYRLAELDLPDRLLCGAHAPSTVARDHTLVDYPFGLTGVYRIDRVDSPLAASYRLLSRLGPLNRRRLDYDLTQLDAMWRQLHDTA